MALLSSDRRLDGRRYRLVDWEGMRVRVWDDARTALKLVELFNDDEADAAVRVEIASRLLFVDADAVTAHVQDIGGLLEQALRQCAGFGERGDKEVMNWATDAPYIRASVQMTYGRTLDELATEVDYETLCYLVSLCPHETPIGQALFYRTAKPPKATKHNQAEREEFRKRQQFWRLKPKARGKKARDRYEVMAHESANAFAALARNARR